jgi:hypothetical protein
VAPWQGPPFALGPRCEKPFDFRVRHSINAAEPDRPDGAVSYATANGATTNAEDLSQLGWSPRRADWSIGHGVTSRE